MLKNISAEKLSHKKLLKRFLWRELCRDRSYLFLLKSKLRVLQGPFTMDDADNESQQGLEVWSVVRCLSGSLTEALGLANGCEANAHGVH